MKHLERICLICGKSIKPEQQMMVGDTWFSLMGKTIHLDIEVAHYFCYGTKPMLRVKEHDEFGSTLSQDYVLNKDGTPYDCDCH